VTNIGVATWKNDGYVVGSGKYFKANSTVEGNMGSKRSWGRIVRDMKNRG